MRFNYLIRNHEICSLVPTEIFKIGRRLFKSRITKDIYLGTEENSIGLIHKWGIGGVHYLIPDKTVKELKIINPSAYISQEKTLWLLVNFVIYKEQFKKIKEGTATFTQSEYLRGRGFTQEQINSGGKGIQLAINGLKCGASTTYLIQGENQPINIYKLEHHRQGREVIYEIEFNEPYKSSLIGEIKGYYPVPLKLIADRETIQKPYLHHFIRELIYLAVRGRESSKKRVDNYLLGMGLEAYKPKETFTLLTKCIKHIEEHYLDILNILCVTIYNNRDPERKIVFDILSKLSNMSYECIKEALRTIGMNDIRECLLSFRAKRKEQQLKYPPENSFEINKSFKKLASDTEYKNKTKMLIFKVFAWKDEHIKNGYSKPLNKTEEELQAFLNSKIMQGGLEQVERVFNLYIDGKWSDTQATVYGFFFKALNDIKPRLEYEMSKLSHKLSMNRTH